MTFKELGVTASRAMLQLLRLLVNSLYFTVSYNIQWTKQYDKKSKHMDGVLRQGGAFSGSPYFLLNYCFAHCEFYNILQSIRLQYLEYFTSYNIILKYYSK